MRNLFLFLREHYFYFLFLLLETFSLILLFNYNEFQGSSLYSVSNAVSGSVNTMFSGISEYFSLKKTNRVLIEEMAKLHSRIPEAFYTTDKNIFYKKDSIVNLEYKYIKRLKTRLPFAESIVRVAPLALLFIGDTKGFADASRDALRVFENGCG